MTNQPILPIDAASALATHAAAAAHAESAQPDHGAGGCIGYESCHPLTWLPDTETEHRTA